jgi:hypothetical protein
MRRRRSVEYSEPLPAIVCEETANHSINKEFKRSGGYFKSIFKTAKSSQNAVAKYHHNDISEFFASTARVRHEDVFTGTRVAGLGN